MYNGDPAGATLAALAAAAPCGPGVTPLVCSLAACLDEAISKDAPAFDTGGDGSEAVARLALLAACHMEA